MTNSKMKRNIKADIIEFLDNNAQWGISLSGHGAVYQLEQKFTKLVGHPYALVITNATSGLWAVFHALEIHNADIITTPYTWGGSLAGLIQTGNRPVFADIDKHTLTLNPESVIHCITPKTKAILAVDIYGFPCNGAALRKIADDYGLLLIQDCSQSFGAYRENKHTGWRADISVFSLTWGKALFAGEGGVIVTKNEELYDKLIWHSQYPYRQLRDIPHFPSNEMAMNLRIHPLAAIWANAAFEDALRSVQRRRKNCFQVLRFLTEQGLSNTKLPDIRTEKPSFHKLTFEPLEKIDKIERILWENGYNYSISLPSITKPIYRHDSYRKFSQKYNWQKHNICPKAKQQSKKRYQLILNKKQKGA